MSDWYVVPVTSGLTDIDDPPMAMALAEGELRVARWSVAITAPRFDVTISGPGES